MARMSVLVTNFPANIKTLKIATGSNISMTNYRAVYLVC